MTLLLALLLLAISIPVQAATWYVSPNGSGTACTVGAPCDWIYGVNTKASGSDTVRFNDGIYLTPLHGYETVKSGTSATSRLTWEAINPRAATIRFRGPSSSGGLTHGLYIQHDNYTIRGLGLNCESSAGDNASDCFQARGRNISASGGTTVHNITFDNIYARNAGHGMFHCLFANNVEVKYSTLDLSGETNDRGEAFYLASCCHNRPCTNLKAHHNVVSRFGENAVDFKDQARNGVLEYNIFADQRTRAVTNVQQAGTSGTALVVANAEVTSGTRAPGNYIRNSMFFRGLTPNVFHIPDSHRFDAHSNVIWGMNPYNGSSPKLIPTNDIPEAEIYNNIHCPHSGNDNMSEGVNHTNGKAPNLLNRPQSECSTRITQLLGVPSIASCEIGSVAGNKTITLNLQANVNGPVSTIGNLSQWTVTYSGTTQSKVSHSITANNKMQIVMASQPVDSSIPVTVQAAAGAIKNSAFLGRYGDCSLSVNVFKTDYGAADSQHKFPNPTPGIGGGVCGESVTAAATTCTNTVGEAAPGEELDQAVWRFYGKDNVEGAVPLAPENAHIMLGLGSAFRWRAGVRGGGSDAPERSYELGARSCTPTCSAWAQVTSNFSVTGVAYRYDTVQDHLSPTTNQLSLGGKTFIPGVFIEDSASTPSVAIATTQQIEWEFALVIPQNASPLSVGDTVELRIQHTDGTPLNSYNLPSITIGTGLSGYRSGVVSGMMQ